jgi:Lar family restriction alleviation protein
MTTPPAALLPCPFCGHDTPEFERMGTPRQSCIVICGNCGARHESSDEGANSGSSWNERAAIASIEAPQASHKAEAGPVAPIDTLHVYKTLCDLVEEANAVDTVIGRPQALHEKLTALRDYFGSMKVGPYFAHPPAPTQPACDFPACDCAPVRPGQCKKHPQLSAPVLRAPTQPVAPPDEQIDALIARCRKRFYPQDMHPHFERAIARGAIALAAAQPPEQPTQAAEVPR